MRTLVLSLVFGAACGGKAPSPAPAPSNVATATPTATPEPAAGPWKGGEGKLAFTINGISPEKGDKEGGTYVVVKGENFIKSGPRHLAVYFGAAKGSVVRFASDGEVIVQAPGGTAGESVDVRLVFDPGGEVVMTKVFTFVDKGSGPGVDALDTKK